MQKRRITVTVDESVYQAALAAVAAGRADSVSGWVNGALAEAQRSGARLDALGEAVAAYEAEHGPITDEEVEAAERQDLAAAAAVRAGRSARRRAG